MDKRVWLDTDPGIGVPFRDIDDGLALLFLLASPEVSVEGISITFGNTKADVGFRVARKLLEVAEAEVPLFKGAASRHELGKPGPAAEALVAAAADNPGQITLLAIGPLTNVATAMALDRNFMNNLRELVVMGGTLKFWPFSYFGEFNFHMDGRAAQKVMAAPVPKTLLCMDLCAQAVFEKKHLTMIEKHDSKVARYLAKTIPSWLKFNRLVFRNKGFFPWDPVAAAFLTHPALFDSMPCTFEVVPDGRRRGRILGLARHLDFEPKNGEVPINMPHEIDGVAFMDLLLKRLLSL